MVSLLCVLTIHSMITTGCRCLIAPEMSMQATQLELREPQKVNNSMGCQT